MLVIVLSVWAAVVLWRLKQSGEAPDPITWGIPGAIWVLLHPRKQAEVEQAEPPPVRPVESEGAP